MASRALQDQIQLVGGRITDIDLEEKAIYLGLGKRVGALHLNWILGGQHEERPLERMGDFRNGDRGLLHCLKQCRLGLWSGTVDLISQDQVGEYRSGPESETPLAVLVD
jgi:hypothetical protein